jgi:hypothetical protein
MTPLTARWYLRCLHCLTIAAVREHPERDLSCGACGGPVEDMGQVQESLLVNPEERTPCDDRCTSARGPLCVCRCGGVNHGVNRLVIMGNGRVDMPDPAEARARAEEYRRGLENLCDQVMELRALQATGHLLSHGDYKRLKLLEKLFRDMTDARTHKTRMRILAQGRVDGRAE